MTSGPKKVDRRKFIYAGLGAIAVIAIGAAAYITMNPPVVTVTQSTAVPTTSIITTTVPTTSVVTTTVPTTTATTVVVTSTYSIPKKKITWWTVVNSGKVVKGQLIGQSPEFENALLAEFVKQYPDIEVEVTTIPWGEFFTKFVSAFEAGKGPDVFYLAGSYAPQWAYSGWAKDLEKFKNEIDLNDFSPTALNIWTFEGKLFGIPLRLDARMLACNMGLIKQAGYDRAPRYWPEEVLEWSKAMTKEDIGQYGIGIVGRQTDSLMYEMWLSWIYTNGGKILSDDMKECVINTPEAIEALQFYCDLLNKYKVAPPGALDYDKDALRTMFVPGKLGMYSDGKFSAADYAKNPQLEWAFDLIPGTKKVRSAQLLGGWGVCMNSQTKYEEEAWKFIKFASEPKWMALWATSVPARSSAVSYGNYFDDDPSRKTWEQAQYGFPPLKHPNNAKMIPIIVQGVAEAVGKKKTPAEALNWIATEINKLLKS
jgi:multiple sugar transport system substrate-binding protein